MSGTLIAAAMYAFFVLAFIGLTAAFVVDGLSAPVTRKQRANRTQTARRSQSVR